MRQFLDLLDDEWKALSRSETSARALAGWTDRALNDFSDFEGVVATIQRRGRPEESDRILLALLRRASRRSS